MKLAAKILFTVVFYALTSLSPFWGSWGMCQDIHFSQFYMSPLTINPALAGNNGDMQGIIVYREQWRSVSDPFKTFAASYDLKVHKSNSGFLSLGGNFFSDRAGDARMGSTNGGISLAYHVYINEYNSLGAGIQGGITQRSVNPEALKWGSQYDGNAYNAGLPSDEPLIASSFTYGDLGTGLLWTYDKSGTSSVTGNDHFVVNIGVGMLHLPRAGFSFYNPENPGEKLHVRYVAHGNALIGVASSKIAFAPGFMTFKQGPSNEIYIGSLVRYLLKQESKYTGLEEGAAFSLGAYYRTRDAIALMMLLEYSHYAFGLSYDVNTSGLKASSNMRGGFEISLRFVNPNPFKSKSATRF